MISIVLATYLCPKWISPICLFLVNMANMGKMQVMEERVALMGASLKSMANRDGLSICKIWKTKDK